MLIHVNRCAYRSTIVPGRNVRPKDHSVRFKTFNLCSSGFPVASPASGRALSSCDCFEFSGQFHKPFVFDASKVSSQNSVEKALFLQPDRRRLQQEICQGERTGIYRRLFPYRKSCKLYQKSYNSRVKESCHLCTVIQLKKALMNQHMHHSDSAPQTRMLLLNALETWRSKEQATLLFKPVNLQYPEEKVQLSVSHEAEFHLIVVNEDLTWFRHLHPELLPDGTYHIALQFPAGGNYTLFADYQPEGLAPVNDRHDIYVSGNMPERTEVLKETLIATADGLDLRIDREEPFTTEAPTPIPIQITRDRTPLRSGDLVPYLGAAAHMILIGKEDKNFLHIHPVSDDRYPVIGHTEFTKAGLYRMWVQFKTAGPVHTAAFTLEVQQGNSMENRTMTGHHHHH